MNKTSWIVALSCLVTAPIGAFAGYALYSLLRSKPINASAWWQQNWLSMVFAGILAAGIFSIIALRMQKLGRW